MLTPALQTWTRASFDVHRYESTPEETKAFSIDNMANRHRLGKSAREDISTLNDKDSTTMTNGISEDIGRVARIGAIAIQHSLEVTAVLFRRFRPLVQASHAKSVRRLSHGYCGYPSSPTVARNGCRSLSFLH